MARSDSQFSQELRRISDLDGYGVEDGDVDPRGWTVMSADGRTLGTVEDLIVDTTTMKVRYFEVRVERGAVATTDDDYVLVDAASARVDEDRGEVVGTALPYSSVSSGYAGSGGSAHAGTGTSDYADIGAQQSTTSSRSSADIDTDTARLTRAEEELRIGKREVARGEARVTKRVETEHVRQPVNVRREEVVIERRPVTEGAQASSIAEDEIRVSLMEEEVVVEKRPVVKEELVIGKRVVEDTEVVETDVRKERFEVEGQPAVANDQSSNRRTASRVDDQ